MKLIVCGLSISSSWGNGHATLLRGLFKELHALGHRVVFFERDTPYYASHRDAASFPYVELHLYPDWDAALPHIRRELADADVGMVTSYCPDGAAAGELMVESHRLRTIFYDMDTPVTLSRLEAGEHISYLPESGLSGFDLVLSYTGGRALQELKTRLGAKRAFPLYGWVDPDLYHHSEPSPRFEGDFSYLGTYSQDRQGALERLFLAPASILKDKRFVIGGAMYPHAETWPANVRFFDHVSPPEHRFFYSSSPLTLNVTRASMAAMGFCPSGRLFEATACGTAILSDRWEGLAEFFDPGSEILIADSTGDALDTLKLHPAEIAAVGRRAKERTLLCHTASIRARRFLSLLESDADDDVSSSCVFATLDET